jgi:hypothetical protein
MKNPAAKINKRQAITINRRKNPAKVRYQPAAFDKLSCR